VLYNIKFPKFVKLAFICIFQDVRVLYYIKVPNFVKFTKLDLFKDFLYAILR